MEKLYKIRGKMIFYNSCDTSYRIRGMAEFIEIQKSQDMKYETTTEFIEVKNSLDMKYEAISYMVKAL